MKQRLHRLQDRRLFTAAMTNLHLYVQHENRDTHMSHGVNNLTYNVALFRTDLKQHRLVTWTWLNGFYVIQISMAPCANLWISSREF
jgi:hypothetical protein